MLDLEAISGGRSFLNVLIAPAAEIMHGADKSYSSCPLLTVTPVG